MSPTLGKLGMGWVARVAHLAAVGCVLCAAGEARAQGVETSDIPSIEPAPGMVESTAEEKGSGVTPLVAPLPFKNSQIGWGVAVMAGLIHRFDADTTVKPSTGAIAGLASENGSWGVMGMEMARFDQDTWRARGVAGYMDLQYDFYGIGIDAGEAGQSVPIDQTFFVASGALLRHVVSGLYVGGQILWLTTTVTLQNPVAFSEQPALPDQGNSQLLAGGLQAEFDTRDDDYWPQRGSLAQLKGNFFTTTTGQSGSFQRYQAAWSWYHGFRGPRLVLATNLLACGAPGDAPFYGLCSLGTGRFSVRGYTQGRYRDHYTTAVQAELRVHTAGRFGAVLFGGFGQVAPEVSKILKAELLPAGGGGLRYQLTRKYPMHLRLDYAWGRDGGLLYFSVGEAI
jgi:surface antigen Omp85-like protein